MKRLPLPTLAFAAATFVASTAHAQFGVPVQGPPLQDAGTVTLLPTLGVVHDDDFTDFAIMMRGRYALTDELSLDGSLGGIVGDLDEFQLGFGGKFELLTREAGFPVDLNAFTQLDLGFGDATVVSWLSGPLISGSFETADGLLTPYGGLGIGFTQLDTDAGNDTELAFGLIFGGDFALREELSTFTEFTIGLTDGLPVLNWHFGVSVPLPG